jgi:hypothetical protein
VVDRQLTGFLNFLGFVRALLERLVVLEQIIFVLGADDLRSQLLDLLCRLFTRDRLRDFALIIVVAVQLSGKFYRGNGNILACPERIIFALGGDDLRSHLLDLLCLLFTRDRLKRVFALIVVAVQLSGEFYRGNGYILACPERIIFALGGDDLRSHLLDLLCFLFTRDRLKRGFALIVVAIQLSGEIHRLGGNGYILSNHPIKSIIASG